MRSHRNYLSYAPTVLLWALLVWFLVANVPTLVTNIRHGLNPQYIEYTTTETHRVPNPDYVP